MNLLRQVNQRIPTISYPFSEVAKNCLPHSMSIVVALLPNGKKRGNEYVSLNPNRSDRKLGSFSINLTSGAWSDFAIGERGGDLISLAAYVRQTSYPEASAWIQSFMQFGDDS